MTHWKSLTDPNYIGSYAFQPGEEKTATIDKTVEEQVIGQDGQISKCIVIHFKEPELKPLIANKTNCKVISKLYSPYLEEWSGKAIILAVQKVKAFGETVDAIRIRPIKPPICELCGNPIKPFGRKNAVELAQYTREKFSKQLCAACAREMKGAEKKNAGDI